MNFEIKLKVKSQRNVHERIYDKSHDRHGGGGPRVVVSTAAFHARVRGSVPGLGGLKETKLFLPHPCVKLSIVFSLRDREVACLASDRQGLNFESCVWRTVSSHSSHHPQEVLLAQPQRWPTARFISLFDRHGKAFTIPRYKNLRQLWRSSVLIRSVFLKQMSIIRISRRSTLPLVGD